MRVGLDGGPVRTLIDSVIANGQVSWREGSQVVSIAPDRSLVLLNVETGTRSVLAKPDSAHTYGFPDVLPGGRAALIIVKPTNAAQDSSMLARSRSPTTGRWRSFRVEPR